MIRMVKKQAVSFFSISFAFFASAHSSVAFSANRGSWGVESQSKVEIKVSEESDIQRSRVTIKRNDGPRGAKPLIKRESIAFEKALKYKRFEKTQELIKQLETLIPRTGQRARRGELQMRLAELYFERGKDVASEESEKWKEEVQKWELLDPANREKQARPNLKTPQADRYRRQALALYMDLEKRSKGADGGRSQSIDREEVLFYLGMTLVDLGQAKSAVNYLSELLKRYPRTPRAYAAKLQLADLYFDGGSFKNAKALYIDLAGDKNTPKLSEELRPYIMYKLAWCYFNTGEYNKAVLAYKKTVDLADSKSTISFKVEAQRDLTRTFALAGMYEEGIEYFSRLDEELLFAHLANSAELAASRGDELGSIKYYTLLIDKDPKSQVAHDYALKRLELFRRFPKKYNFFEKFKEYVESYDAKSSWMDKRSEEEQKIYTEEVVALMRREAKALHRTGQRRQSTGYLAAAANYYKLYFDRVPSPNSDSDINKNEMYFYYAELLYKLKRYDEAAKAYEMVGPGKYSSNAGYSRILALREASAKNKSKSSELIKATDDFIQKNPNDDRGSDLLYASAFEAYSDGEKGLSQKSLLAVIEKYPSTDTGLKAAERYLFILEEQGDLDEAIKGTDQLLANKELMKAHGNTLSKRLSLAKEKLQFKKVEKLAESSDGDRSEKAKAFLALAPSLSRSLEEKAYNNALVLAEKSKDSETAKLAGDSLLKKFPKSSYSKGLYLVQAEEIARKGDWSKALSAYKKYLISNKQKKALDKDEFENALWNKIFIQAHLEDQVGVEVVRSRSPSKDLEASLDEFLSSYPRSQFRDAVIEIQAFKNTVSDQDLALLRRLPNLSSSEREMIDQAMLARRIRTTSSSGRSSLLKQYPASKAKDLPWALRKTLAQWEFESLEGAYQAYRKYRLNFSGKAFASTLKVKTAKLEGLEKSYLGVVAYGDGDFALRSVSRLAEMYDGFAKELSKAPVPKADLQAFVDPFDAKTKDLLLDCLEKAKDFKIIGPGLDSCRAGLRSREPGALHLTYENEPNPGFIADPDNANVLWNSAKAGASSKGRGKMLLAYKVAQGEITEGRMDNDYLPYFDNLIALTLWTDGRTEQAVSMLRKATDAGGSSLKSLRTSASMNLAAIFVKTGDYGEAKSLMEGLEDNSATAAYISGSAHVGDGDFAGAAKIYSKAYSKFKDSNFIFHEALAKKKNGDSAGGVKLLKKYIDIDTPASSHISRKLLKEWN